MCMFCQMHPLWICRDNCKLEIGSRSGIQKPTFEFLHLYQVQLNDADQGNTDAIIHLTRDGGKV